MLKSYKVGLKADIALVYSVIILEISKERVSYMRHKCSYLVRSSRLKLDVDKTYLLIVILALA